MNQAVRVTPQLPEPIKVRELRFCIPGGRDVPMTNTNGGRPSIKAGEAGDRLVTIQYEPWQRHHRVREYVNGKLSSEFCVPESWVMYVPEVWSPERSAPEGRK